MRKHILLFVLLLSFCSVKTSSGQSITIGADGIVRCENVAIGTTQNIGFDTYEAVDQDLLIQRRDEGADLSKVCVSNVEQMAGMFKSSSFNQDISGWDVSNVTSMIGMFWVNDSFNQDIGKWDVSKVENMMLMFSRANAFNQDIGEWDVSNVTNMSEMFTRNDVFNGDIGSWDVSAVTNMTAMFKDAISFSQDLSSWCAPLISDPGSSFASGSPLEVNSGFLPNWGCNLAPVPLISASGVSGQAPYSIDFDATGSTDANGDAMTFTWDFGDGATAEGKTVSHTYTAAGDYKVVLVVSDGIKNAADSYQCLHCLRRGHRSHRAA